MKFHSFGPFPPESLPYLWINLVIFGLIFLWLHFYKE